MNTASNFHQHERSQRTSTYQRGQHYGYGYVTNGEPFRNKYGERNRKEFPSRATNPHQSSIQQPASNPPFQNQSSSLQRMATAKEPPVWMEQPGWRHLQANSYCRGPQLYRRTSVDSVSSHSDLTSPPLMASSAPVNPATLSHHLHHGTGMFQNNGGGGGHHAARHGDSSRKQSSYPGVFYPRRINCACPPHSACVCYAAQINNPSSTLTPAATNQQLNYQAPPPPPSSSYHRHGCVSAPTWINSKPFERQQSQSTDALQDLSRWMGRNSFQSNGSSVSSEHGNAPSQSLTPTGTDVQENSRVKSSATTKIQDKHTPVALPPAKEEQPNETRKTITHCKTPKCQDKKSTPIGGELKRETSVEVCGHQETKHNVNEENAKLLPPWPQKRKAEEEENNLASSTKPDNGCPVKSEFVYWGGHETPSKKRKLDSEVIVIDDESSSDESETSPADDSEENDDQKKDTFVLNAGNQEKRFVETPFYDVACNTSLPSDEQLEKDLEDLMGPLKVDVPSAGLYINREYLDENVLGAISSNDFIENDAISKSADEDLTEQCQRMTSDVEKHHSMSIDEDGRPNSNKSSNMIVSKSLFCKKTKLSKTNCIPGKRAAIITSQESNSKDDIVSGADKPSTITDSAKRTDGDDVRTTERKIKSKPEVVSKCTMRQEPKVKHSKPIIDMKRSSGSKSSSKISENKIAFKNFFKPKRRSSWKKKVASNLSKIDEVINVDFERHEKETAIKKAARKTISKNVIRPDSPSSEHSTPNDHQSSDQCLLLRELQKPTPKLKARKSIYGSGVVKRQLSTADVPTAHRAETPRTFYMSPVRTWKRSTTNRVRFNTLASLQAMKKDCMSKVSLRFQSGLEKKIFHLISAGNIERLSSYDKTIKQHVAWSMRKLSCVHATNAMVDLSNSHIFLDSDSLRKHGISTVHS